MSGTPAPAALSPELLKKALSTYLFPGKEALNTYAILDGASVPDLMDHLYDGVRPEFVCLYRGELEPDMAEVAPYLIRLKPEEPFTRWLLSEGWGKHWGIFALSKADLVAMRKHFRTFLMVKDPAGKQLYFRYYDPRVLRVYLPTCNVSEAATVFGQVARYVLEGDDNGTALRFSRVEGMPHLEKSHLAG